MKAESQLHWCGYSPPAGTVYSRVLAKPQGGVPFWSFCTATVTLAIPATWHLATDTICVRISFNRITVVTF